MNKILFCSLLPIALGANGGCLTDPTEMGDIGPESALVCRDLDRRFPGASLAVEGRSIHSPAAVTVAASVNGRPILLAYRLTGFSWTTDDSDRAVEEAAARPTRLSQGR